MFTVVIECSNTGRPLATEISLDQASEGQSINCPHCGSVHSLSKNASHVIIPIAEYERLKILESGKAARAAE